MDQTLDREPADVSSEYDADTVELQLSPEQIEWLSRAYQVGITPPRPIAATPEPPEAVPRPVATAPSPAETILAPAAPALDVLQPVPHSAAGFPAGRVHALRSGRAALLACLATVICLSGGAAYLAASGEQTLPAPAPVEAIVTSQAPIPRSAESPGSDAPAPSAATESNTPVHFANPFDASEVFEFPPGTSKADAHKAVAGMLLERARDRLRSSPNRAVSVHQPAAGCPSSRRYGDAVPSNCSTSPANCCGKGGL
jgi:hypothetical protein